MSTQNISTISGDGVFFKFREIEYDEIKNSKEVDYVRKLKNNGIDGFVVKSVLSDEEVKSVKDYIETIPDEELLNFPAGKIYPAVFSTINGAHDGFGKYYHALNSYNSKVASGNTPLSMLTQRLEDFFLNTANSYQVKVPRNTLNNQLVAASTFRFFVPGAGNLHVHCGHSHQPRDNGAQLQKPVNESEAKFYDILPADFDYHPQLSYFLVLQNPEAGGELTVYDLLWDERITKDYPENNEFLIDPNGEKLYLKDLKSFAIRPMAGDILVFSGGPIWHRVEEVKGSIPRITFGGFVNFTKDDKAMYYWS
jgi:carrier-protein-independent halogenase WelO5-like protein